MKFHKHPGKLRGIGKIQYPARVIGIGLAGFVYYMNQIQLGELSTWDYILIAGTIIYPHLAVFIYWKTDSNRTVETNMLLADALYSGIAVPFMLFNPLPSIAMCAFTAAGTMVAKGWQHFLKGLAIIAIGIGIGILLNGGQLEMKYHSEKELVLAVMSFVVLYALLFSFASNQFVLQIINNKRLIAHQQELIEEQHQDILDSINYAKRIQTAILPSNDLWKQKLPKSFVLYIPKDVVAGDFYWMNETTNGVLFAAADCTGHGVPGAMVSVVCNNGLNRAVREYGLNDPGQILTKTRELVISELSTGGDVKDGMDISMVRLNQDNSLLYAGANNPIWTIRSGSNEVEEIKANKQPIGQFENASDFTTHALQLNDGDRFYLFSDGFADQFGGQDQKKYKSRRFKQFLISIQHMSIEEQQKALESEFEQWKGEMEQLDDICIIGVEI